MTRSARSRVFIDRQATRAARPHTVMNRSFFALIAAALVLAAPRAARGQQTPTPAQAQAAMNDPAIRARIMAQVKNSGMTPDQIRDAFRAGGYSPCEVEEFTDILESRIDQLNRL